VEEKKEELTMAEKIRKRKEQRNSKGASMNNSLTNVA
jgi:hypothetical protein